MKKTGLFIFLLAALLLAGCSNEPKVIENTAKSKSTQVHTAPLPTDATSTTTSAETTVIVSSQLSIDDEDDITPEPIITEPEETSQGTMTGAWMTPAYSDTSESFITTTDTALEVETTVSFVTTTAETTVAATVDEVKKVYALSADDNAFIAKCVFVGDSICSGLKAYDILPANHVLAVGNVAARNIFEDWVEFKVSGSKMPLKQAIAAAQPEYIVFSMGMNDVNMTSKEAFCANYDKIFSACKEAAPDAQLIVLSITPITYRDDGKIFTYNSTIDDFNAALKAHVTETGTAKYVNVAKGLKNANNLLKAEYLGSPDGVHLAPGAYTAILKQLCEQMIGE